MPKKTTHTQPRQMRIPSEEWFPFEDAARVERPTGPSPRTAVVRQFMRWYMRRPGAKLPERPPTGPWSKPDTTEET